MTFTSNVDVMDPGCAKFVSSVPAGKAEMMVRSGQARIIDSPKLRKGANNCAIRRIVLAQRPEVDDTKMLSRATGIPTGTKYVFLEHLDTGNHTYQHKALPQPDKSECSADGFFRSIFRRVQLDCLVTE